MKKFLISGLVLSLVLAFTGCDNDTTTSSLEEETRVVDPRYRGEFLRTPNQELSWKIAITDTEYFYASGGGVPRDYDITLNKNYLKYSSVYTVVYEDGSAALYAISGNNPPISFKDKDTIKYGDNIFTRRVD